MTGYKPLWLKPQAVAFVMKGNGGKHSNDTKLKFYALFKQVSVLLTRNDDTLRPTFVTTKQPGRKQKQ